MMNLYENERDQIPQFDVKAKANKVKEEVENLINMRKNGKGTGPDEIPIEALKVLD